MGESSFMSVISPLTVPVGPDCTGPARVKGTRTNPVTKTPQEVNRMTASQPKRSVLYDERAGKHVVLDLGDAPQLLVEGVFGLDDDIGPQLEAGSQGDPRQIGNIDEIGPLLVDGIAPIPPNVGDEPVVGPVGDLRVRALVGEAGRGIAGKLAHFGLAQRVALHELGAEIDVVPVEVRVEAVVP